MEWFWILLAPAAGLAGAAVGLYASTGLLRRAVRELQYGLADLEDRLTREVKKRAAAARWEADVEPETAKDELRSGFLHPGDFARQKSARRMNRGTQARAPAQEDAG